MNMINQEDVCIWFKDLEGHLRMELMCALFDSCLPLELRFLGTYLEYSAGKHYTHLQKWEKDVNSDNLSDVADLTDTKIRRRFCIALALLHSHNRTMAMKLFNILRMHDVALESNSGSLEPTQELRPTTGSDRSSKNEMKLIMTMGSLHPAFEFNQRRLLRQKLNSYSKRNSNLQKSEPIDHSNINVNSHSVKIESSIDEKISSCSNNPLTSNSERRQDLLEESSSNLPYSNDTVKGNTIFSSQTRILPLNSTAFMNGPSLIPAASVVPISEHSSNRHHQTTSSDPRFPLPIETFHPYPSPAYSSVRMPPLFSPRLLNPVPLKLPPTAPPLPQGMTMFNGIPNNGIPNLNHGEPTNNLNPVTWSIPLGSNVPPIQHFPLLSTLTHSSNSNMNNNNSLQSISSVIINPAPINSQISVSLMNQSISIMSHMVLAPTIVSQVTTVSSSFRTTNPEIDDQLSLNTVLSPKPYVDCTVLSPKSYVDNIVMSPKPVADENIELSRYSVSDLSNPTFIEPERKDKNLSDVVVYREPSPHTKLHPNPKELVTCSAVLTLTEIEQLPLNTSPKMNPNIPVESENVADLSLEVMSTVHIDAPLIQTGIGPATPIHASNAAISPIHTSLVHCNTIEVESNNSSLPPPLLNVNPPSPKTKEIPPEIEPNTPVGAVSLPQMSSNDDVSVYRSTRRGNTVHLVVPKTKQCDDGNLVITTVATDSQKNMFSPTDGSPSRSPRSKSSVGVLNDDNSILTLYRDGELLTVSDAKTVIFPQSFIKYLGNREGCKVISPSMNGVVKPMFPQTVYVTSPNFYNSEASSSTKMATLHPYDVPVTYHRSRTSSNSSVMSMHSTVSKTNDSSPSTPSQSPPTSPRPSPKQSPLLVRKVRSCFSGNKRDFFAFASVSDWLKSLRLHKYSDPLTNYTFQQMRNITDKEMIDMGMTRGARQKFLTNVQSLHKKGFKEFGMHNYRIEYQIPGQEHTQPQQSIQPETRYQSPGSEPPLPVETSTEYPIPPYPVAYQNSDVLLPVTTVAMPPSSQTYQGGAKFSTKSSETSSVSSDFSSRSTSPISVNTPDLPLSPPTPSWASRKTSIHSENNYKTVLSLLPNCSVASSVNDYLVRQSHVMTPNDMAHPSNSYPTIYSGKSNHFITHLEQGSDDEASYCDFTKGDDKSRPDSPPPPSHAFPTCYNCGLTGHYGDECLETTMETQTYMRYAYHLDFTRRRSSSPDLHKYSHNSNENKAR